MCIALGTKQILQFVLFQRIQYAKTDSDVISKIKGTFQERPKKIRPPPSKDEDAPKKKKKNKDPNRVAANNAEQPPNQILFLTNLPDETSEMMLSMLFNQYVPNLSICTLFIIFKNRTSLIFFAKKKY